MPVRLSVTARPLVDLTKKVKGKSVCTGSRGSLTIEIEGRFPGGPRSG
jgi:hypothetical protein